LEFICKPHGYKGKGFWSFENLKEASLKFTANTGWFSRLKNWQQLHNIELSSEWACSDALTAGQFPGI
jgi:hypothetical protein